MSYEVKTRVFEGPLDLLLQLITSHQVEITELSLVELVNEYIRHLELMEEMDIEVTSEFLLIAAISKGASQPAPTVEIEGCDVNGPAKRCNRFFMSAAVTMHVAQCPQYGWIFRRQLSRALDCGGQHEHLRYAPMQPE